MARVGPPKSAFGSRTSPASGGARTIEWRHDPALRSGLRVRCAGAVMDATVEGLLARRADIEADFLAEYLCRE